MTNGLPKVVLLNNGNKYSSLGLYSNQIYECLTSNGFQCKLYSTAYDNKIHSYYGDAYPGVSAGKYSKYVNAILTPVVYHKLISELNKLKEEGWIIHYASNSITPLIEGDIVTLHDVGFTTYELYKKIASYYGKWFIFNKFIKYRNIIVPSHDVKSKLENLGIKDSNIKVIHQGVMQYIKPLKNKMQLREKLGLPLDKLLLLSVSTNKPNKNLAILENLSRNLDNSKFSIVRVGEGVERAFHFVNVDADTLNLIYNACDIFIMPSFEEGFGYPIIEALSVGLPIALSDIPIFHEIVSEAGSFFNPSDPKSAEDAIFRIIENLDRYVSFSKARSSHFSNKSYCKRMLEYYTEINSNYC